ncbi:MAG: DUF3426 domain-containing protein [Ignavibacteria bacterium]
MLTRCPRCQTTFRVTPDQLKARHGRVRCGHCQDVFDALEALIEEPRPVALSANEAAPESTPETPAPATPAVPIVPADASAASDIQDEPETGQALQASGAEEPSASSEPVAVPDLQAEPATAAESPATDADPATAGLPEAAIPAGEDATAAEAPSAPPPAPAPPPPAAADRQPEENEGAAASLSPPAPEAAPTPAAVEAPAAAEPELAAPEKTAPDAPTPALEPLLHQEAPQRKWPWALGSAAALALLLMQAAIHYRTEIAVLSPGMKPLLEGLCAPFGCEVDLPRKVELIGIEASGLSPESDGRLSLSATLKNRAPFVQQFPDLEVTLSDTGDQPLVRRVLTPAEYLPPQALAGGFGPRSEVAVNLLVEAPNVPAAGYQLYVFYP